MSTKSVESSLRNRTELESTLELEIVLKQIVGI